MVTPIGGSKQFEYEKLIVDEWLEGIIVDIQLRKNDHRKYKNEDTGEWAEKSVDELRFAFEFKGYKFKHYSRWITQSMHEKAALYAKYIKELCPDLEPNALIDIDQLKGIAVKVMWKDNKNTKTGIVYQEIAQIRPLDKLKKEDLLYKHAEPTEIESEDALPF